MTNPRLAAAQRAEAAGLAADAEALCREVLAAEPANVDAQLLLAKIARRLGRTSEARTLLTEILRRDPNCVEALTRLARSHRSEQRHDEAVELSRRAIAADPKNADAHFILGICLVDSWENEEAVKEFQTAIELDPSSAFAYDRLGFTLQRLGRLPEAIAAFRTAADLNAKLPHSALNLGEALRLSGDEAGATEAFKRAAGMAAGSSTALASLAQAFLAGENLEQSTEVLKQAVALDPSSPELWLRLGNVQITSGDFAAGEAALRRSLALDPDIIRTYFDLMFAMKVKEEDLPLVRHLQKLVERPQNPEARLQGNYALGKAFDDMGQYEQAMRYYRAANLAAAGRQDGAPYDQAAHRASVDYLISTFNAKTLNQMRAYGNLTERPVFIVGMPRSGTTLVEQILSSHPDVAPAGEITYLAEHVGSAIHTYPEWNKELTRSISEGYLRRITALNVSARYVTDKLPYNFTIAGILNAVFPNARIIHCRRSPIDTCLSIFLTPISAEYGNIPENIIFFYREYERLMAHWREVIPADRLLEINYEDLVSAGEPILRNLIEFLDLEWDDAVLHHDSNRRVINTPSRWQAKQPLYTSSVERWRRYEPWLGEFATLIDR